MGESGIKWVYVLLFGEVNHIFSLESMAPRGCRGTQSISQKARSVKARRPSARGLDSGMALVVY
jgi:hypothetical protein